MSIECLWGYFAWEHFETRPLVLPVCYVRRFPQVVGAENHSRKEEVRLSRILAPYLAAYLLIATKVRDIEEAFKEVVARRNVEEILRLEKEWLVAKDQLKFAIEALKGGKST